MFRRVRILGVREQRRKQLRDLENLKKRGDLASFSATPTKSGFQVAYNFSNAAATDINAGVFARLLGVPKVAILQLELDAKRHNILYNSVPQTLDSLFSFTSDQRYLSLLADAAAHAQELRQVVSNSLTNPYALKLKQAKLPDIDVDTVEEELRREHAQKLGLKSGRNIHSGFKAAAEAYHAGLTNAKGTVQKNELVFSTSLRVSDSLEAIVADVEGVARDGSPEAAYFYFTRWVRITLPDNAEQRGQFVFNNLYRFSALIKGKNNGLLKLLRLTQLVDFRTSYVDIGKLGLDDILLVLDQEEKRTRYGSRIRHAQSNVFNFIYTPLEIIAFAEALGKIGAQPHSVADLLSEVPIGQRKSAFKALKKDPGLVKLYEQLRDYGADARSYISFVTDFANVEVKLDGDKRTLQNIVGELAVDGTSRSGAAWLVKHPEVWERSDLTQILDLARNNHASMKLELYNKWSDDPVKSNVVLELAPALSAVNVGALAAALQKIDREDLKFIPKLTLDGVLSLQQIEPQEAGSSYPPAAESRVSTERVSNRILWANLAYQGNLELIDAALRAYEAVPLYLRHRIKQVDAYVREHNNPAVLASALLQYFSQITQISRRSPDLIKYVFASDSFFTPFLEQIIKKGVVDEQFVGQLEGIVRKNSNPYGDLYDVLAHEQKIKTPKGIIFSAMSRRLAVTEVQMNGNGNAVLEGVVYRIAVFGHFDDKRQNMITSKLGGTNVELVFFNKDVRGSTYPDCDGVAIFQGASTGLTIPHSSAAMSHYESRGLPMKPMGRIVNVDRVAEALVEFRNELFLKSAGKVSA